MRRLYTRLSQDEADALLEVARAERRRPSDQAAVLIADGLRQRGVLPTPSQRSDPPKTGDDKRTEVSSGCAA